MVDSKTNTIIFGVLLASAFMSVYALYEGSSPEASPALGMVTIMRSWTVDNIIHTLLLATPLETS